MTKLRTKLQLRTIGKTGISMDMTINKGASLIALMVHIVKFIPVDLVVAREKLIKAIDTQLPEPVNDLQVQNDRLKVIITEREQTIDCLTAQVELLRQKLDDFDAYSKPDVIYRTSPFGQSVVDLLNQTKQQCLAGIQADAIDEALNAVGNVCQEDLDNALTDYANKLRINSENL